MNQSTPRPAAPNNRRPFQFGLRTLLLLFVVLGSSLTVFGGWGVLVFGLAAGTALYLRNFNPLNVWTVLVAVVVCAILLLASVFPEIESPREASRRVSCMNNLGQLSRALQAYHDAHGAYPPAYIADKNGRPMHSWRVLILPYLDRADLYKAYDFSQPWDSPKNKKLLAVRVSVFACPSDSQAFAANGYKTSYVAVVGPNAAWSGDKPMKRGDLDFPDRDATTVMLIEAPNSGIAWTEPRDFSLDTSGSSLAAALAPAAEIHHERRDDFFIIREQGPGIHVATAAGFVSMLKTPGVSDDELRKRLQIGGFTVDAEADREGRINWPKIAALAVWLLSVAALFAQAVRGRSTVPTVLTPSPEGGDKP